jgi:hypothetical protein
MADNGSSYADSIGKLSRSKLTGFQQHPDTLDHTILFDYKSTE